MVADPLIESEVNHHSHNPTISNTPPPSILFWNATSITHKLHQLHEVATSSSPPLVIAVAEAKLPLRTQSSSPRLPSYSTLSFPSRSDRSSGMVVFIHDRIG